MTLPVSLPRSRDRFVDRATRQPRADPFELPRLADLLQKPHENGMSRIFCLVPTANDPVGNPSQSHLVTLNNRGKGGLVSLLKVQQQLLVGRQGRSRRRFLIAFTFHSDT